MEWIKTAGSCDLIVMLLGIAILSGACFIVAKSRRPALIAAYLVFVPLPPIVACFGFIIGLRNCFSVIASGAAIPEPTDWFAGFASSLSMMIFGLIPPILAYAVIAIGLFIRTFDTTRQAAAR